MQRDPLTNHSNYTGTVDKFTDAAAAAAGGHTHDAVAAAAAEPVDPHDYQQRCMSTERLDAMFKKTDNKDKRSGGDIFRAALERLSFRRSSSGKRRKGGKNKYEVVVTEKAPASACGDSVSESDNIPAAAAVTSDINSEKIPTIPPVGKAVEQTTPTETMANKPPLPPGGSSRRRPPPPASATWEQSRPLTQLDSALRNFRSATAESRENLTASRPDISAIEAEVKKSITGKMSDIL